MSLLPIGLNQVAADLLQFDDQRATRTRVDYWGDSTLPEKCATFMLFLRFRSP